MTKGPMKCYGATSAETIRRDDCGSAMARRMRRRHGATSAEALLIVASEAIWRDACVYALARRQRKRYGAAPAQALWRDAGGGALT